MTNTKFRVTQILFSGSKIWISRNKMEFVFKSTLPKTMTTRGIAMTKLDVCEDSEKHIYVHDIIIYLLTFNISFYSYIRKNKIDICYARE